MVEKKDFLKNFSKKELVSRLNLEGFIDKALVSHTHAFNGKLGGEEILTVNDTEIKFLNGEELLTFRDTSQILNILEKFKTVNRIEFKNVLGPGVSLSFEMNGYKDAFEKFKKSVL